MFVRRIATRHPIFIHIATPAHTTHTLHPFNNLIPADAKYQTIFSIQICALSIKNKNGTQKMGAPLITHTQIYTHILLYIISDSPGHCITPHIATDRFCTPFSCF